VGVTLAAAQVVGGRASGGRSATQLPSSRLLPCSRAATAARPGGLGHALIGWPVLARPPARAASAARAPALGPAVRWGAGAYQQHEVARVVAQQVARAIRVDLPVRLRRASARPSSPEPPICRPALHAGELHTQLIWRARAHQTAPSLNRQARMPARCDTLKPEYPMSTLAGPPAQQPNACAATLAAPRGGRARRRTRTIVAASATDLAGWPPARYAMLASPTTTTPPSGAGTGMSMAAPASRLLCRQGPSTSSCARRPHGASDRFRVG